MVSANGERWTDMVVYRAEDLLGCDHEGHHLPDCHLKIHLWKFEEPLEEARHSQFIPAGGRCATKV